MPAWPIWLLLHMGLAAGLTACARSYALHRKLLDEPGERRSHASATPRGGGISIVIALLLAAAWLAWRFHEHRMMAACYGVGLAMVAGIGWLDDHRPLSPWLRLAVHGLAAALLAAGLWREGGNYWQVLAGFLLAVGLTNIWNFMDGINGLATSQAMLIAGGLGFVLGPPWHWLALALAGASLGFLPFNFPRARIFLGDVGSGSLGFSLATLLALALEQGSNMLLLALPAAAFLVDAPFTLAWRILNRQRWWTPHVEHAYQRWARRWGHAPVTIGFFLFTSAAATAGLAMEIRAADGLAAFIICYGVAAGMWSWSRRLTD